VTLLSITDSALRSKVKYFAWAAVRSFHSDVSCPACGAANTKIVKRKYLVTSLRRCEQCRLMFRVPKPAAAETERFYQDGYKEGFTTDCPTPERLRELLNSGFRNSEKNYAGYESVLAAVGLRGCQTLFDFGCSWGYGSWQLRQAGYDVYSYEVSVPRATYAATQLGCRIVRPGEMEESVDCFFSAHVIEHLPNPRIIFSAARRLLKRDGWLVLFTPNGDPSLEALMPGYHKLWGQPHPLLLTSEALLIMAEAHGFDGRTYTSPFDLDGIASRRPGSLSGGELAFIGRHTK
jgi:hypothetical protein